jgi:membrane protein implicated in regulation of membrane protease activity
MLAIGLAAGALAAHAGGSVAAQLVVAAIVGGGAAVGLRLQHRRGAQEPPDAASNRDVNLDIGETVQVDAWQPDGTAVVRHRGANWTVVAAPGSKHGHGAHRVREVVGSRLVVEKIS